MMGGISYCYPVADVPLTQSLIAKSLVKSQEYDSDNMGMSYVFILSLDHADICPR